MSKKLSSKGKCQRKHAKRRALERYGIDFTHQNMIDLKHHIMSGRSQNVVTQSNRVTIHTLEWQGQTVRVVYDKLRKNIVSFLPLDKTPE